MNCAKVRSRLDALLFDLLDPDLTRTIRDHLEHCPDCSQRWTVITSEWKVLDEWTVTHTTTPDPNLLMRSYQLPGIGLRQQNHPSLAGLLHWELVLLRVQNKHSVFCA